MVVMEALGEGLVVEPYLATVGLGGRFVARAGTPAQQKRILPALIAGQAQLAFAHTERGARYDLAPCGHARAAAGERLRARRREARGAARRRRRHAGRLRAHRRRRHATPAGISLFLVDAEAPGVTLKEYRTIDELRAADVWLTGVRVGRRRAAGRAKAQALPLIEDVADYATALLCAEAVGAIRYANDATLEYLKTRRQFGVPIGSFQALQHRMVDMVISYEQARSMACLACVKVDSARRRPSGAASSPRPRSRSRTPAAT